MGVFASGPSATSVDIAGIAAGMRPALYAWFNARIQVWDLKRNAADSYDPVNDSGGSATGALVLDSGAGGALVQPIRSPTRVDVGAQPSGLLGIRFQLKRVSAESGQTLRGGLVVKVLDGGESNDLDGYLFALAETVDSSLAWGRIWDAVLVTGGI